MRRFIIPVLLLALTACQESMEDKAERDAREYTRRYCPTPIINNVRTDSIVFDKVKHTYTYYMAFFNEMDDENLINEHRDEIQSSLQGAQSQSTGMKTYVEAGYKFEYICRSGSEPKKVLFKSARQ